MTKTENNVVSDMPETWFTLFVTDGASALTACDGLEAATEALKNSESRVAMFYMPPSQAMARRLGAGASVQQALAGWIGECGALLDLQRANRRRMALFETPAQSTPSEDLRAALTAAMDGAEWPTDAAAPSSVADMEPLAALALNSQPEARELMDHLQAATHGGVSEQLSDVALLEAALTVGRDPAACVQELEASLQKSEAARQDETTALQAQLDEASGMRDIAVKQAAELEANLQKSEAARQGETTALQAQLDESNGLQDIAVKQAAELEANLQKSEAARQDETTALQAQLDEASGLQDIAAKQVAELEANLRESNETWHAETTALQAQLDEASGMRDIGASQVAELEASLQKLAATAHRNETARHEETSALQAQLSEHANQALDLRESLRNSEATRREETAELQARLRAAEKSLDRQNDELSDMRKSAEEAQLTQEQVGAVLQQQVVTLQGALLDSERDRELIQAEKLRLDGVWRRKVADLSHMLDVLQGSSSWRLTRPARSIMRRIRS